jgi:hypothetical protein
MGRGEIGDQRAGPAFLRGAEHQRGNLRVFGEIFAHHFLAFALPHRDHRHLAAFRQDVAGGRGRQRFGAGARLFLDRRLDARESIEILLRHQRQ